jgi:hypothetical protein
MSREERNQVLPKNNVRSWGFGLTLALWLVGVALQFAAPLLRDKVPLSDDLFITSILTPWWVFLQVLLLTGWLWIFRRRADKWAKRTRMVFAVVSAFFLMLLEPNMLTQIIAHEVPLSLNPVGAALIWSTPLFFYVLPATLVIFSWLTRPHWLPLARALGLGLVIIGILSFGYIFWLTHLWDLYIRPFGGESVLSMNLPGFFG